jgi:integrase
MKAGRAHRVPLSDPALAILETVHPLAVMRDGRPDADAPLFPGERRALPLSSTAMRMLLRRMKREGVTVHGMRSAFRDWVSEATAFPGELAEGALAHLVGDAAERAYRRGDALDRRRELMAAWARFCEGLASAEVVPLRAVAQ